MLPWVKRQIEGTLGFKPVLGTLNLQLTAASSLRKKQLDKTKAALIVPAKGFCVGLLFKASISGIACALILPEVEGYPENVLEIVAPVNLRKVLRLQDGDVVSISVQT
jgi:riboflavin kinase, archaea type